jgi:carnitine monooxygenase subunit
MRKSGMEYDHKTGFVAYPDAEPGSPAAKAPYIDHGTGKIDPKRYYTPEEAALEWEHVWTKSWVVVGISHDIPEVGDWFKAELGKESFIIVRNGPGDEGIAAYFNVCPHRGNRIVHTDFGSTGSGSCFQCDFHGWKFGLDGKNVEIRDEFIFRKEAIAHRPGLKPVRCAVWNSLVFISMDPDGKSLMEHLDVIPTHLAPYPFHQYKVIRDLETCWDANWKTALDAFVEFYHSDDVHPQLLTFTETLECQYDLYANGNSRMIIPVGYVTSRNEDRETVTDALKGFLQFYGGNPDDYTHLKGHEYFKALVDVRRQWARRHGYTHFDNLTDNQINDDWNYFIFPNITINAFSDSLLLQMFYPHASDPSKSYYRAISLCLPVGGSQDMVMDPAQFGPEAMSEPGWDGSIRPAKVIPETLEDYGSVLAQDAVRVPEVQKGIESSAFGGYVLSESESRIRHYLAEVDRLIGRT